MLLFPTPGRGRNRVERVPERIEISTPPALRSYSSAESGDARVKEVFDLHIQELFERGEASGSVANTLNAFANQIRLLNGQVSSMQKEWQNENRLMKDKVGRLATEVATQADADRMRMIVQRFAGEVIPDSRAIVRQAIDEQSEVVDQRINSLSGEVRESVRDLEGGMSQLQKLVEDKQYAMFKSQGAFQDEIYTEIGNFEKQFHSVEKAVRLLSSSGGCAASGLDRAASSGDDASFRDLVARVDRLQGESDRHGEWATSAIDELRAEYRSFADRMLESRSDGGSLLADRPRDLESPQDWRGAVEEINRKIQDLANRVRRQARNYDTVVEDVRAVNGQIVVFNANTQRLQQAMEEIRTRLVDLPSTTDEMQAVVRRELVYYRNMLDACMRRLGATKNNIRTLNEMNTRVMSQFADLEGSIEDAAGLVQLAHDHPRGHGGRPNGGYHAFVGQGHRITPTPTPGDGNAPDSVPPNRPGGGVSLTDHVLPNAPSPPRRTREESLARARANRANVSISPDRGG